MTTIYIFMAYIFLRIDKDCIFDHKLPCSWYANDTYIYANYDDSTDVNLVPKSPHKIRT